MQSWKKSLSIAVGVFLLGITVTGCVGFKNAMTDPVQRSSIVTVEGLPSSTEPIKIALLSDIHTGNAVMRPERLASLVQTVNDAAPDIVVLAGDFVIGENARGAARRAEDLYPLAGLKAPHGVFAVLGNHDHWTDPSAIKSSLARAGVTVLENDARRIGPIAVVGIDDRFSLHDDISLSFERAAAVGGLPIVLTHSPDLTDDLPNGVWIVLAGHTHCGQMVAPLVGPIVRTHQDTPLYNQRYRCGRIDEDNRSVFVTAGVGSGAVPLRFGAPPDWWLIEIRPNPQGASAVHLQWTSAP